MTSKNMNLKSTALVLFIALSLTLSRGTDAIVKQPRSDDAPSVSSVSSSVSVSSSSSSSSSSASQPSAASSVSQSQTSSGQSGQNYGPTSGQSGQQSQSAYPSYKQQVSSYVDSMNSAANAPDSSYQVAAQNVNMALANSGIFGPSGYSQNQAQQQPTSGQQQASGSQQLNPLHYYYYPSKESGQQQAVAPKSASGANQANQQYDMMSNAASTNYQTGYPTYADQMGMQPAPSVDAAASSQDPSYLPQPANDQSGSLYANNQQQAQQSQHQQGQQQQHQLTQQYNGDLMAAYSNNQQAQQLQSQQQQPQQSAGSVTFQGPSSNQQQQQQAQPAPDFMGGFQGSGVYANQMGDLSTSNFGNNAGGLSSVASYMSPSQSQGSMSQQAPGQSQQGDLFSAAAALQGFSSAASQLTGAVAPPGAQSLFSANNPYATSAQQQQQANSNNNNNQLFASSQYLNQYLTPEQIRQLTGGSLDGSGQLQPAASSPVSSVAQASGGSSKRFGIGSFIMPMLALAGLSLLIPTMSNLGTAVAGRKKRSIGEERASGASRRQQIVHEPANGLSAASQLDKEMSIGEYMDRIERYYSIYKDAVENEDCLNRLICEFGDAVKDVNGKSIVVTVIEKLVPNWMTGKVHLFKEAALSSKEGKERCQKYICSSGHQGSRKH